MAKIEQGSSTVVSTGSKIIVIADDTLSIEKIVFLIANSSTDVSSGFSDGSVNFTSNVLYGDTSTTKSIVHYRNISGIKTKTFEAVVTDLDVGEFTINVTTCTQSTPLKLTIYGS